MHELSIVQSVVQSVCEWMQTQPPVRVKTVTLRVGTLSAVVEDALQFGYGVATEGTPLAGTTLVVNTLPIVVYCPQCQSLGELPATQAFLFVCPTCGTPTGDVRQGREIEIESLEIEDEE